MKRFYDLHETVVEDGETMLALRRIPRTETEAAKKYIEGAHPVHTRHTRAQTHKRAHTSTVSFSLIHPTSAVIQRDGRLRGVPHLPAETCGDP